MAQMATVSSAGTRYSGITDQMSMRVTNIQTIIKQTRELLAAERTEDPPTYKDCVFEGFVADLEDKVSELKILVEQQRLLDKDSSPTSVTQKESSENSAESKQKAEETAESTVPLCDQNAKVNSDVELFKAFLNQQQTSRLNCMDNLNKMNIAMEALQQIWDRCIDEEQKAKKHEKYKAKLDPFVNCMKTMEMTTNIFVSEKPALLEGAQKIEKILEHQVLLNSNAKQKQMLNALKKLREKISSADPQSFVSATSCFWDRYNTETMPLHCKKDLEETATQISRAVNDYVDDACSYGELLQKLVDEISTE
ncbi:unnamed protein product [Calicophoron daubneyi]|uniref:Uncharacterized protein n=1 Tax=Calicophoron daubneyi TaxID=300641 RepID=A0AAV2T147_CALDB